MIDIDPISYITPILTQNPFFFLCSSQTKVIMVLAHDTTLIIMISGKELRTTLNTIAVEVVTAPSESALVLTR